MTCSPSSSDFFALKHSVHTYRVPLNVFKLTSDLVEDILDNVSAGDSESEASEFNSALTGNLEYFGDCCYEHT